MRGWRRGRAATTVHGVAVVGGGMVAAGSVTVAAEAATGAAAKVTEAAGRCDSVRVATEVAVFGGTWAECSDRSGAGGTAAAGAATGAAVEVPTAAVHGVQQRSRWLWARGPSPAVLVMQGRLKSGANPERVARRRRP